MDSRRAVPGLRGQSSPTLASQIAMHPPPSHPSLRAFTLIELLVVIAIIAVLAGLLFPVFGRVRAAGDSTKCAANLKQIGAGINAYANDHEDTLPGPLYEAQSPWYATPYKDGSMAALLQDYLGLKPMEEWGQRASVFVCPAYEKAVKTSVAPDYGVLPLPKSKKLGASFGDSQMRPFGNPDSPRYDAMKRTLLATADDDDGLPFRLSQIVAVRDIDKGDYSTGARPAWYDALPDKPVHGDYQNALFYDWHVAKVDSTTHLPK